MYTIINVYGIRMTCVFMISWGINPGRLQVAGVPHLRFGAGIVAKHRLQFMGHADLSSPCVRHQPLHPGSELAYPPSEHNERC